MPLFQLTGDAIHPIPATTFSAAGIREREDLQRLLRRQIGTIAGETLIISEEFCDWEDSKRRVDLLGLDKDANLVVIELKRTEDGGHMELQAVRYAAMVSAMTLDKAVDVYSRYLKRLGSDLDARTDLLGFLEWDQPNNDFNKRVRIILVSAEFSKEVTTTVLWLRDQDIDIRCIRMKPYSHNGSLIVDVQPIIPIPEASAYQVRMREKSREERIDRRTIKDFTKYDVTIKGATEIGMAKRRAILHIVKYLVAEGVAPQRFSELLPWRGTGRLFISAAGMLAGDQFIQAIAAMEAPEGKQVEYHRFFCGDGDLINLEGFTYAFSNQWGTRTAEAMKTIIEAFPEKEISFTISE